MNTFLFNEIIFGPVKSRRLGISLGINLLPIDLKLCNFNCIYCECGWSNKIDENQIVLPSRETVKSSLDTRLNIMKTTNKLLDVITFAGNGEPTIHPEFAGIIDDTIILRNKYFPNARIAVLSNSTMLNDNSIFEALKKVEQNILKLDSAFIDTIQVLNHAHENYTVENTIKNLLKFNGKLIIQTMFVKGIYQGIKIDNTSEKEISAWLETIKRINPEMVMIYTIARATPADNLEKIPFAKLSEIGEKVQALGIETQISS